MPGCDGLAPGQTPGLNASLTVSTPANGTHFVAGERATLTLKLKDRCDRLYDVANLNMAALYMVGPRRGLLARTADKLLNCLMDRANSQHHFIDLRSPSFADTSQNNLSKAADGTITYTFGAVTTEPPGTYTIGVRAEASGGADQVFELAEIQIGTATREEYASGPVASASCFSCHKNETNGHTYLQHSIPSSGAPFGSWARDMRPIGTCQLCHNNDGFSPNNTFRRVHSVHRGEHLTNPGVAHPEYGLTNPDPALASFTNVMFPVMPGHELDCQKCHVGNEWKTAPSRMACGTCHDNLFFDTGVLNPPRVLGVPTAGPCAVNGDCSAFGSSSHVTCNVTSGRCERTSHDPQGDDSQCTTCHTAGGSGASPIPERHDIPGRTRIRNLRITNATLTGATGPGGVFLVGDVPVLTFGLTDGAGTPVTDLRTNTALGATTVGSGPTDDRQRIYFVNNMKTAALTYDSAAGRYTYTFTALPANALPPFNTTGAPPRVNPSGTYSIYFYVVETFAGGQWRDSVGEVIDFKFGADMPIRPRQVISKNACNACHVDLQLHGGMRSDPEACSNCHTRGALDRGVGSRGRACTTDAQCPGNFASPPWETCQDLAPVDGTPDTCAVTVDPTPNASIRFPFMIHSIHFARRRGRYLEASFIPPNTFSRLGFNNMLTDFSEVLFPQDIRNCRKCHADTGATCNSSTPCGVGQECISGACVNRSWTKPSTEICLSCHTTEATWGHTQINTYFGGPTPIETCDVCHGPGREFAVESVHNISSPYVPPYPRTAE